jgi:hypothetical protein
MEGDAKELKQRWLFIVPHTHSELPVTSQLVYYTKETFT